jgi:hypothetical protein
MSCEHHGNLVICHGPEMREVRREPWETRWCFKCRKRLPHDSVVMAPVELSYYGPRVKVECHGCGGDHVHFPGTWDGPTLVLGDA